MGLGSFLPLSWALHFPGCGTCFNEPLVQIFKSFLEMVQTGGDWETGKQSTGRKREAGEQNQGCVERGKEREAALCEGHLLIGKYLAKIPRRKRF